MGGATASARVQAAAPAFVQDAAIAHAVFTPEQRHPVEVGAGEQTHLLQWLSRRLGTPLQAPDFSAQGFALVGGRLLPAGAGEATPPARAQFMYQDAPGARLTLYVSVLPPGPPRTGGLRAGAKRRHPQLLLARGPAGRPGRAGLPTADPNPWVRAP